MEEKANGISVEAISQLENDAEFHELVEKTRRLNIFEVLGITKTEIRHSNFLAWLLDPKEAHGLGRKRNSPRIRPIASCAGSGCT